MASKKPNTQKKISAKKRPERSMADQICDRALEIAAAEEWSSVTLNRLSRELKIPLGELIQTFATTGQIRTHVFRQIDKEMVARVKSIDEQDSVRDRLFEVLMMRFDALQARRAGIEAILASLKRSPLQMIYRTTALMHSMALALVSAGVTTDGPVGMARVKILTAAYVTVLWTWLKDDSPDLAQTMSALDKALSRLERLATMSVFQRRRKSGSADQ